MRQRTILSSVHGQRWPGCSTGNAFKKIVAALFLFILLNGCIIPAFAASEKKLEKVSILERDQGAPLVVIDMDALVFDYSGLKAGKESKTIRTLTGLLLFLIGASLVGLLWMRIFCAPERSEQEDIRIAQGENGSGK